MSYTELRLYAEVFQDVQDFRTSSANKIRSGTIDDDIANLSQIMEVLDSVEHQMSLAMRKTMRKTVAPSILRWQKEQNGIGEHLLARLLGIIGDPYTASPYHWEGTGSNRVLIADPPFTRTVSQLWAYCGHGDPTRRPQRGMSAQEAAALGNPAAKMLTFLLAEACVRAGVRTLEGSDERKAISKYGQVYLDARHRYEDSVHPDACVRCGPSGKPAPAGSERSPGHQHAMALRKVGKELLKDLWIAARNDHNEIVPIDTPAER